MVVCIAITCLVCIPCCCYRIRKIPKFQDYLLNSQKPYKRMGLMCGFLKQVLWIITRFLFLLFRTIIWLLLLRYCKIWSNHRKTAYKRTVHVQKILARHKLDHMIQPASPSNFLTMHEMFKDPEYVRNKYVTLYCLTKRDAVFVECDPKIDVTKSEVSSFLRIAQFKHAKRLIFVPLHVFTQLGKQIGEFQGNLIFLTNTGRCGSTLLTQVFEETNKCISVSEPDALNTLVNIQEDTPTEQVDELVKATINILCKKCDANISSVVVKLSQINLPLVPYLARLYPNSHNLFMYRDGIYVAKSVAKIIKGTPMAGLLAFLARNRACMRISKFIARSAGLPIKDYDELDTVQSVLQVGTTMWASAIRQYLDFQKVGINIAAVRYEDMIGDTEYALNQIFQFCNMAYDNEAVDTAFSRDSQRGSPISQERLGQFDHEEITDEVRELTDYCCNVFKVPSIYRTYIADNTITYRSITADVMAEGLTISESGTIYYESDETSNINVHTSCAANVQKDHFNHCSKVKLNSKVEMISEVQMRNEGNKDVINV